MTLRIKSTGQRLTNFLRRRTPLAPSAPTEGAGVQFAQRAKLAYVGAVNGHGSTIYADERSQVVITHKAGRRSLAVAV